MYDPVARRNDSANIGYLSFRILFIYLVGSLTDYTDITLNGTPKHQVFLIFIESLRDLIKKERCALRCLSIYQLFCLVQFFLKIWIPYSTILHQINRTFEKILESEFELEIILPINH